MPPSMKDVAERASVSIATVSRVLANKPNVRQSVRDRVRQAVDELGYRPNRVASTLRTRSSNIIGLLVSDIRNPFFTDIARAIEDAAHAEDMSVFLCNTDEDPEKEKKYLQMLLSEHVSGIILSPAHDDIASLDIVVQQDIPVVTIDRPLTDTPFDCVLSDNRTAAYKLTTHLIQNGHQQIAAVMGIKGSYTGEERIHGYRQALQDHHLMPLPDFTRFVFPQEDNSEKIVREWLQQKEAPGAIITGNSQLTIGALNAIQKHGLMIPQDIALAGFDETTWMPHAASGITVISQPTYKMGQIAAKLLFERIHDPDIPQQKITLNGQLIVRQSSR